MKKAVPWLCTLGYSICGGLFVTCTMYCQSIIMSPFYAGDSSRFLAFCVGGCIGSALFMIGTLVFNVVCFPAFDYRHKAETVIVAEGILALVLFFPSWKLWDSVIRVLPTLF